jgi:hypothetical protein
MTVTCMLSIRAIVDCLQAYVYSGDASRLGGRLLLSSGAPQVHHEPAE